MKSTPKYTLNILLAGVLALSPMVTVAQAKPSVTPTTPAATAKVDAPSVPSRDDQMRELQREFNELSTRSKLLYEYLHGLQEFQDYIQVQSDLQKKYQEGQALQQQIDAEKAKSK